MVDNDHEISLGAGNSTADNLRSGVDFNLGVLRGPAGNDDRAVALDAHQVE